jgi:hypothetical protein
MLTVPIGAVAHTITGFGLAESLMGDAVAGGDDAAAAPSNNTPATPARTSRPRLVAPPGFARSRRALNRRTPCMKAERQR